MGGSHVGAHWGRMGGLAPRVQTILIGEKTINRHHLMGVVGKEGGKVVSVNPSRVECAGQKQ